MKTLKLSYLLSAIWLGTTFVTAEELVSPPPAPLSPEIVEASRRAVPKNFPDADTVLLADREHIVYQPDGLDVSTDDFYEKALTDRGRDRMRSIDLGYNSSYSKLKIDGIEIFKPDGRIVRPDIKAVSRDVSSPGQLSSNIYDPAMRQLQIALPDLETDDILHLVVRSITHKTRTPGAWSGFFPLQGESPFLFYEVTIDAPKSLPLASVSIKDEVKDAVTSSTEKPGDRIVYRWSARNVPQIIPEPDMPPVHMVAQRLLASTSRDWREVSKWYWELCEPRMKTITPAMREKVKTLISGKSDDQSKMMAIFQFVSQQIRYLGITAEQGAPGFEPHDVALTFENRHGVCRDKAALLAALLREAGFKAFPCLFMAGTPLDAETPMPYFNHAVVAVEKSPGIYQLMDPTVETTTEFLPAMLGNMSYLVARPEGETLLRSPVAPPSANRMNVTTKAKLEASGEMRGSTEFEFGGINDTIYRGFFSSQPRDAARQFFAATVRRCIPGGELLEFKLEPDDLRDMSRPLRANITYSASGYVPSGGGGFPLPAPLFGNRIGASALVLRGATIMQHRKYPLQLFSTTSGVETFSMEMPSAIAVRAVPSSGGESQPGVAAFKSSFDCRNGVFSGRREFETSSVELSPADYNALKVLLRRLDFADRHAAAVASFDYAAVDAAGLRREFPDSDLLVVSSDRQILLRDRHNWSEKAIQHFRVLTYAGMKNLSEIKIPFEPGREKVVLSARVTAPDGKVTETRSGEVKVVDLPLAGAVARYPLKKQAVLPIAGVTVGAMVEVNIEKETSGQPFFHLDEMFADRNVVLHKRLVLECPGKIASELRCSEPPPLVEFNSTESREGGRRLEWHAANLPVVRAESGQPPDRMFMPSVSITLGTLKSYAAELNAVLKKAAAEQSAAMNEAQVFKLNFASTKPDPDWFNKRLRKIRDFVADRIILGGPAFNTMTFDKIFPADRTLADGCGNSADKAVLLAAILNALGIDTRFVAVSDMGADSDALMSFARRPGNYFDRILVYLPEYRIYLNDSSKYAPPGVTASAGRIGLDLESGLLLTVTSPRRFSDRERVNYMIRLKSNGAAEIDVVCRYGGRSFEQANKMYSFMTPEKRRLHFDALAENFSQAARIAGEPEIDFTGDTGTVKYRLTVPDFAACSGDFMEFQLPEFDRFLARLGTVSTDRKTPYRRNDALLMEKSYDIEWPEGYSIIDNRPSRRDFGAAGSSRKSESFRRESGRALIEIELDLPVETIQPCDYSHLVQLQRELAAPSAGRIVLKKNKK